MDRKDELKALGAKFGTCGCKERCEMEQHGEAGRERKPNGYYSVCEIEADDLGVKIPKKPAR